MCSKNFRACFQPAQAVLWVLAQINSAGAIANLATRMEWLWENGPVLKCWHKNPQVPDFVVLSKVPRKTKAEFLGANETHGKNIGNSSLVKRLYIKNVPSEGKHVTIHIV